MVNPSSRFPDLERPAPPERKAMARTIMADAPVVRFVVNVMNLRNGTVMEFHTHDVFAKDFQEVHDILTKFGSFITPLQTASMEKSE